MLKIKNGYTFDDVLLIPKYSEIESRKNVDLSTDLGKGIKLDIPVISANMKNVTGLHMAEKIASLGGLALLHRFYDNPLVGQLDVFTKIIEKHPQYVNNIGVSVGVNKKDLEQVNIFVANGVKIVCVDIAHAHSKLCGDMVYNIAKKFPELLLIVGNIATAEGAKFLYENGADVYKCGIGGGSVCVTRVEAGNGSPQLTALSEIYDALPNNYKIIADGGIRSGGDIVKSLCFSHAVMLGNLLAGTDEAPGDIIRARDGNLYKQYAGSSTHKANHIEGVVGLVPAKGSVENILTKLLEGVRSGLSYQGAKNLEELRKDPEFVLLSNAGLIESHPHDIKL